MSFPPSNPTSGFTSPSGWRPHDDAPAIGTILLGPGAPTPPPAEDELPPPTHFAKPVATGLGDGSSLENAFTLADFTALSLNPGDHCGCDDGVYTGASSYIQPTAGVHGTPEDRIIISALSDGAVRINGGFNADPGPVRLSTNNYWLIQGIDAHGGENSAFQMFNCKGSIFRRFVAWDHDPARNGAVVHGIECADCLAEDFGAFGSGSRMLQGYKSMRNVAGDSGMTFRRGWVQWERHDQEDNTNKAVQLGYQGYRDTGENLFVTFDQVGTQTTQKWRGLLCTGRIDEPAGFDPDSDSGFWGSMGYILAGQNAGQLQNLSDGFQDGLSTTHGGNTFQDIVLLAEQAPSNNIARLQAQTPRGLYKNATEIDLAGTGSSIHADWDVENRVVVSSVGAAPNPFATTRPATGAWIRKRTVDRVETDDDLWPFPMDARIRAALTTSGRDPDTIFGGAGNGLTELMESIFSVSLS